MTIAWNLFTPASALLGGAIIGLAVTLLLLFNGKIAGISGILGGLLIWSKENSGWRLSFMLGLLTAPLLYSCFAPLPEAHIDSSNSALIVSGLLVGVGTRYGSGCTSGHGVCGISRLSLRSLVATMIFMAVGFITVFVMRHWG